MEIKDVYNIDDYLLNLDEEITERDTQDKLQRWQELPLAKIEKIVNYIKVLENQNDFCDKELDRIKTCKKSNEKKIDNLKKYLTFLINKPTKIGSYTLSTRKSESVEILDETKVPEQFKTQKITYTINKTAIKDFLTKDIINPETGEVERIECDWAEIKNNTSLIIK